MKIKLINPNTTWELTTELKEHVQKYVRNDTEIMAVSPQMGPVSIESFYDDYLSIPGTLEEVRRGELEGGIDAYVIACFGDPGLWGARELATVPVLGIAEAAMHMASMIAPAFTIVTTLPRTRLMTEHLLYQYGMKNKCRSIRTTPLHVLDVQNEASVNLIIQECRKAVKEDQAEAIVLGCAAMSIHRQRIEQEAMVPVIDGTLAAVKFCEALVDLGVQTSKILTFSKPEVKFYSGILQHFGR